MVHKLYCITQEKISLHLCTVPALCSRLQVSAVVCFDFKFADLVFLGEDLDLSNRLGCSSSLENELQVNLRNAMLNFFALYREKRDNRLFNVSSLLLYID